MDIPLGDPPVPDDLPMQAAVDLNTYFAAGRRSAIRRKVRRPRALPSGHDDAGEAADLGRTAETAAVPRKLKRMIFVDTGHNCLRGRSADCGRNWI